MIKRKDDVEAEREENKEMNNESTTKRNAMFFPPVGWITTIIHHQYTVRLI